MTLAYILLVAAAAYFFGSAVFFGWSSGIDGLLMSPILAVFGLHVSPVALWLVIFFWWAYRPNFGSWIYQFSFVTICGVVGLLASFLVVPALFSGDSVLEEALRVSFSVSGAFAGALIILLKRKESPPPTQNETVQGRQV